MSRAVSFLNSPAGFLEIVSDGEALTSVRFCEKAGQNFPDALTREAEKELTEYFSGSRKTFFLPLHFDGTPFQKAVWNALLKIPCGQTVCYADLAAAIHSEAVRAVGTAVGKNPFAVIVPCHRVIQKDGSVGNYAYGRWRKEKLLQLEKAI